LRFEKASLFTGSLGTLTPASAGFATMPSWGPDGTVWGFEILAVDGDRFERLGRLRPVALAGGEAAVREPWRVATAWLHDAFDGEPGPLPPSLARVDDRSREVLLCMIDRGVNTPLASSAGRWFDAVAALVGLRDHVAYEGQAAVELEAAAGSLPADPYPLDVVDAGPGGAWAPAFEIDPRPTIRAIVADVSEGCPVGRIAARFHDTVVAAIVAGARRACRERDVATVALSGGTFQNARILEGAIVALGAGGFDVLVHRELPPNDGGLAYGQAAVAARRLARSAGPVEVPVVRAAGVGR